MAEYSRFPANTYPKSLSYYLNRLSGFQRQKVRLVTQLQSGSVGPNQYAEIILPRGLVDLSTFQLNGRLDSVGAATSAPRDVETLIESIQTSTGAGMIDFVQDYGRVFSVVADTSFGRGARDRRGVLQFGQDITNDVPVVTAAAGAAVVFTPAAPAQLAAVPGNKYTSGQFSIKSWLGFLGSAAPDVYPSFLTGDTRVRITFGDASRMLGAKDPYVLKDLEVTVDVISINDSVYSEALTRHLASNQTLDIPFKSFHTFKQSNTNCKMTQRIGWSTHSLDQVWAWFNDDLDVADTTTTPVSGTSPYFKRSPATGDAITDWVLELNGTRFPQVPITPTNTFALLEEVLGIQNCTQFSMNPNLNNLAKWLSQPLFAWNFAYENSPDGRLISGLNLEGQQSNISWITNGAGRNNTSTILLRYSPILSVGAGGVIFVKQ